MVRATRRVACSVPRFGFSRSSRSGSEFGPSTSVSMIGAQLSDEVAGQLGLHARVVDRDRWPAGSAGCGRPSPTGCGSPPPSAAARRGCAGTSRASTSRCRAGRTARGGSGRRPGSAARSRRRGTRAGTRLLCARYRSAKAARRRVAVRELRPARRAARTGAGGRSRSPRRRVAGRHDDSTRPTTFRSRSSASRPRRRRPRRRRPACAASPRCPTRGGEITSRQLLGELGRLGQRLGEGELRLEGAGRQVALVVELAGVGDPLVDQDQARAVRVEQLAQRVAGAGRRLVVGLRRGRTPSCRRAARPARPTACGRPCRRAW